MKGGDGVTHPYEYVGFLEVYIHYVLKDISIDKVRLNQRNLEEQSPDHVIQPRGSPA